MKKHKIDLNADLGESYGVFQIGQDEKILPWITSANLACGYHGGDPKTIYQTVKKAIQHQVQIGAHPSLPDFMGFGRRKMQIPPDELYHLLIYQLGALDAFTRVCGTKLHHVKPHGALYHLSAEQEEIADSIAKAVSDFNPDLILFGPAKSHSIKAAKKYGLRVAEEVFADRTYQPDGTLTPRTAKQAIIEHAEEAIQQALDIILHNQVKTVTGETIPLRGDTICLHGDHPKADQFAEQLYQALQANGIEIKGVA